MRSVPGADRGPRAGSPRGVVDATGLQRIAMIEVGKAYPVATAPGTDLIHKPVLNSANEQVLRFFLRPLVRFQGALAQAN